MSGDLPIVSSWKGRSYMAGSVLGLAVGLLAAYLFVRATEERGKVDPPHVGTMDALRLGVAVLAIVRQITDWASKD